MKKISTIIGALALISVAALGSSCQSNTVPEGTGKIETTEAVTPTATGETESSQQESENATDVFYTYPTTVAVPSIKTIDAAIEEITGGVGEVALVSNLTIEEGPNDWKESNYVYPYANDEEIIHRVTHNRDAYTQLLLDNGFAYHDKGFYVKNNVGVICGLFPADASGGELTVFIFEGFDAFTNDKNYELRYFGEIDEPSITLDSAASSL